MIVGKMEDPPRLWKMAGFFNYSDNLFFWSYIYGIFKDFILDLLFIK